MNTALEITLALVTVASALAFGGVEPLAYSLMEVALFAALLLLLIHQLRKGRLCLHVPLWPVIFLVWAALALVPLPVKLLATLSPARISGASVGALRLVESGWTTLSIDRHLTLLAFLKFSSYVIAFILAAYLFDSRKRKSILLKSLILLGVFEAGYGIFQYLTNSSKIFTYTDIFNIHNATGTYVNRNHFAGLLEMVMPFLLASAYYAFSKPSNFSHGAGGRGVASRDSAMVETIFYLFLMVVMFLALILSRSRGGILAAAFSLVFVALLGQVRGGGKRWALSVVILLTLIAGYGLWIGLGPALSRFEQLGHTGSLRTQVRTEIWKDTLNLVDEYPLAGTGLGTFGVASPRYQTVVVEKYLDHAHDDYLEFASETGWLGLAVLFLPILYLFARMILSFLDDSHRYRRSILLGCIGSTLALLVHSLTDFNLQIPANALIFAVVLGIAYKAACVEPRAEQGRTAAMQ